MSFLGVPEAARRLGVSPQRVRALILGQRLRAFRIGRPWVVDEEAIARMQRAGAGRPMRAANAWALLALMEHENPEWIGQSVAVRLHRFAERRERLADLLLHGEPRAHVVSFRVHPADLPRVEASLGGVRSGLSVDVPALDIVPRPEMLDCYVAGGEAASIEKDFRAIRDAVEPNVILRIPSHPWILGRDVAPPSVIAADLLSDDDARARRAARSFFEGNR